MIVLKDFIGRMSIRKKVYVAYSICINALLLIAVMAIYFYLFHLFEAQSQSNLSQISERTSEQVNMLVDSMDELALIISMNPTVKNVLSNAASSDRDANYFDTNLVDKNKIYEALLSLTAFNKYKYRISIYNDTGSYISIGSPDETEVILKRLNSNDFNQLINEIRALEGRELLIDSHDDFWSDNPDEQYVSLIREVRTLENDVVSFGFIEVQIDYDVFERVCKISETMRAVLINEENEVFYPMEYERQTPVTRDYYEQIKSSPESNMKLQVGDSDEFEYLSVNYSKKNGLYLIGIMSESVVKNAFRPVLNVIIMSIVTIVIMNMVLVHFITRNAFKPLNELTDSILDISIENLNLDIAQSSDNNVTKLNEAFELLFGRIKSYMDQLVKLRTMEMKAQYNALQAQMSPHFIYNMLSVISAAAQEIEALHIMDMCQKLSEMIHYVAHYEDVPVTIEDEISHTRNYLALMSCRYESKFDFSINVAEGMAQVKVPKMIVQPFIENAFSHGFKKSPAPWHIDILIKGSDTHWCIEVRDNGGGMSKEAINRQMDRVHECINNEDTSEALKIGGMSMVNVAKRLHLQFGNEKTFQIHSQNPTGLCVILGGTVND